jgi:hypothetical protein
MQMSPSAGQRVIYNHGNPVIVLAYPEGTVTVEGLGESPMRDGRAAFGVTFDNRSHSSIDFGLENLTATDGAGRPVRIYSARDLEREARTNAMIQALAVGLNSAGQSMAAAQPSYSTYSGSYYGTSRYTAYNRYNRSIGSLNGQQSGAFYGSSTTYNPAQTALANQAIQQNASTQMGGIQGRLAQSIAFTSQVLARTTVSPNSSVSGLVITKRASRVNLLIEVGGSSQTATFEIK